MPSHSSKMPQPGFELPQNQSAPAHHAAVNSFLDCVTAAEVVLHEQRFSLEITEGPVL